MLNYGAYAIVIIGGVWLVGEINLCRHKSRGLGQNAIRASDPSQKPPLDIVYCILVSIN